MGLILVVLLVYGLPIWLAHRIGTGKGRQYGWLWGLLLGWIGVLVVAVLGPKDTELSSLEREVKLAELQRKRDELARP